MFHRRKRDRKSVSAANYRWDPRFLRQEVYAATATLVVCLFVGAGILDQFVKQTGSPYIAAVLSAVLVDLTNTDRATENVLQLRINPKLVAAAQAKADDMATKGYFAHQTPDGYDSWHWFEVVGYDYTHAGENLAVDFSESSDVEKAWMNSPTHRRNILNENYTEIGIAVATGTYKGHAAIFAVQLFGRPSAVETAKAVGAPPAASPPPSAATNVLGESAITEPVQVDEDGDAALILLPEDVPWWARAAAQPKQTLRYAYYIIGLLLLLGLFFDMEWEIKKHHVQHAVKTGFVLVTMSMLFIVADWLFFAEPILAAIGRLIQ